MSLQETWNTFIRQNRLELAIHVREEFIDFFEQLTLLTIKEVDGKMYLLEFRHPTEGHVQCIVKTFSAFGVDCDVFKNQHNWIRIRRIFVGIYYGDETILSSEAAAIKQFFYRMHKMSEATIQKEK